MKTRNTDLDRLLRSAASFPEEPPSEPPLGFETRVVASWRAENGGMRAAAELAFLLRTIGAVAIVVFLLAGAGVYQQFNENEARTAPQTNEYAIADSAIQTEFSP